jgi:hypothetical protein
MRILVGCEFSGVVREAFRALGHDAWSCDFLNTEIPGQHYQGDVRDLLNEYWDLAIFHPSCQFLTNAGVRWLYSEAGRWQKMVEGAEFFRLLLNAPIARIAVENPIPHRYALEIIGQSYTQIIQPWQFGHGETKGTCLWLKNLPKLKSTNEVSGRVHRIHKMPGGKNQSINRSRTYAGVANAMASQCGACLTTLALDGAIALDNQQVLPADVLVGEGTLPEPPRQ